MLTAEVAPFAVSTSSTLRLDTFVYRNMRAVLRFVPAANVTDKFPDSDPEAINPKTH
jgi:hypothetical protein